MTSSMMIFYLLAALLVLSSLIVVFQRNVVHCAMALVAALFLIAILFVTLQAPMVGVLQILVYAGAIMVLFLFVIMLLNPTSLEPRRGLSWGFGTVVALLLAGALTALGRQDDAPADPFAATAVLRAPEWKARRLCADCGRPSEIASVLLLIAI